MGEPYVTFPGTTGRYASCPDVNLLDADTAHLHQSIGDWANGDFLTGTVQSTALTPLFGSFHGEGTVVGTPSYCTAGTTPGSSGFPVSPSTQYALVMEVAASVAGRDVAAVIIWYDSSGGFLSSSTGTAVAVNTSMFTTAFVTATSPATAAYARMVVQMTKTGGGNLAAGDKPYWDKICFRAGSDATFVPSLRIVGNLDMRVKVAAADYTSGSNEALVSKWDSAGSQKSYRLQLDGIGGMKFQGSYDGVVGSSIILSSPNMGLTDGSVYELKLTVDIDDGGTNHVLEWFVDNVSIGTSTAAGTSPLFSGNAPLEVGTVDLGVSVPLNGDMYWAEVRDGIDGPVAARFDARQVLAAVS